MVEASDAGIIGKLLVAEGTEDVEVGAVIALFTTEGDAPPRHWLQRPSQSPRRRRKRQSLSSPL
jgi:pyruvate/2-oxoglutarate dehydrogenase complex dihydrolipoamide acyltransferase (E2) component